MSETRTGRAMELTIDLSGKVAVVIGSSEGIGQAIAVALARAGAKMVLGGREEARMADTLGAIGEVGGHGRFGEIDVRAPDSIKAFGAELHAQEGAATILVNSMGGSLVKRLEDVEVEEWDNLHATHLRGTLLTCQMALEGMRSQGYGKIINLSSLAGFSVAKDRGSYSAAKAGLNQLTRALASEWGPYGIRVNGIAPGTTRTPRALLGFERDPTREAGIIARTPLGRIATPDDMVGAALFFASEMSDFITGQTIMVDGGLMSAR